MAAKIVKHELIPLHEKLSSEEKEKLFKEMGINFRDLPKIHKGDATLAEMDAKPGDIIRIKRKSTTAKETIFYRGILDA